MQRKGRETASIYGSDKNTAVMSEILYQAQNPMIFGYHNFLFQGKYSIEK